MNRSTLLHQTPELTVSRFDHPAHEVHCDPEHEVASGWHINFVQAGRFDVVVERERTALRAGGVFITRPGLGFSCRHGDACPDDVCISVAFTADAIAGHEEAWTRAPWVAREASTPRLAYTNGRLARAAACRDAFELDRWASATVHALGDDASGEFVRGAYAARPTDIDAVIATCEAIEREPAARFDVASRARTVHRTGAQLTHAFRRYLRLSPHQYVIRWRLIDATRRLNDGATVSDSCYRSGFENLSHFCRTFQRALGVRASAWRTAPLAERRRKVQDLAAGRA